MKTWTNEEWIALQTRCGREVHLQDGPLYSCLLFHKGKLIMVGISQVSQEDAITHCRESLVKKNILKMLDSAYTRQLQKANLRAAKKILNK